MKINPGDLVFDVGCNIGDKAQTYLNMGAKVIGFEPQKKCANYAAFRFGDMDFTMEPIALSNYKGNASLWESNAPTISSMSKQFIDTVKDGRFKEYSWGSEIKVNVDTLDNMIDKYGKPNYIKIDVEGYELNVLKGLTQPIPLISIEFTPELIENTLVCIEYLGEGKMYNYGSQNNNYYTFDEWVDKETITKYLESLKDYKIEFGDVYIKTI
jgi:FkbM family methyltransferase